MTALLMQNAQQYSQTDIPAARELFVLAFRIEQHYCDDVQPRMCAQPVGLALGVYHAL